MHNASVTPWPIITAMFLYIRLTAAARSAIEERVSVHWVEDYTQADLCTDPACHLSDIEHIHRKGTS
jgi:hypothetical protein